MGFPDRADGAVGHGEGGQNEENRLDVGSVHEGRTVHIIGDSHNRIHAGVYDRDRVQKRGDGRRRDRGLGQPAAQREYRRLGGKADERKRVGKAQRQDL